MFTKLSTGTAALAFLLAAQGALADGHGDWKRQRHNGPPAYDYARVLDVEPIMQRVRVSVPRRECYLETRYEEDYPPDRPRVYPARGAAGSMILGGLIGAAVGNQVGRGDGRRAATVAGAIIGSALGHDAAERRAARGYEPYGAYRGAPESRSYEVERCDTRYEDDWEERVDGYRVTYDYHGQIRTTRLPYDPGDRMRVRVDVRPDEDC